MKKVVFLFVLILSVAALNAQTRTAIRLSDLPKAASDNLSSQHQGWNAVDAYKVDSKGMMTYEVTAKKGPSETVLVYDKDGKYLKMEPKKGSMEPTAKASSMHKKEAGKMKK